MFWLLRFECHLCFFVNYEVHDEREEKREERQGLLVLIFAILQLSSVRFENFVVEPGFSPKLRGRNNRT